ncbi:MAG: hypothetical protein H0W07_09320 [Chloroflexi bacterium]|nr:hypothetical protein [Chloroflexota bacterium]
MAAPPLAVMVMLLAPGATRACSGPPLTFDDVVIGSELIVEGTVEELMLDGMAYRLGVTEVFKGTVLGDEVRIGPASGPVGRGCEVGLQFGQHVVLGVVDVDAPLNSLATAVWFVAPDGSLSSPGSLWELASDIEDLREQLRQAIPDTAVEVSSGGTPGGLVILGLACVLSAILLRLWSGDRGHAVLPGARLRTGG